MPSENKPSVIAASQSPGGMRPTGLQRGLKNGGLGSASRLVTAALAIGSLSACSGAVASDRFGSQADAQVGKIVISRQACGSCHEIPGIEEANGNVGPSLEHFASRQTIAGVLPNSPKALFRYLRNPQGIVEGNYMPKQNLSERQAIAVSSYLYTLR